MSERTTLPAAASSIASALLVFAGFWILGDELDQARAEHRAWQIALVGSLVGVLAAGLSERRLGGSPPNWPLFLGIASAVAGVLVVLFTFAPGANA